MGRGGDFELLMEVAKNYLYPLPVHLSFFDHKVCEEHRCYFRLYQGNSIRRSFPQETFLFLYQEEIHFPQFYQFLGTEQIEAITASKSFKKLAAASGLESSTEI